MVDIERAKINKRAYPQFWDKFIPAAVILISLIILFLAYITIRVALGFRAF